MVYPALLPLMRTTRLPVVDWTDAPADLNGLIRFNERWNLVSARVPSQFKTQCNSVSICVAVCIGAWQQCVAVCSWISSGCVSVMPNTAIQRSELQSTYIRINQHPHILFLSAILILYTHLHISYPRWSQHFTSNFRLNLWNAFLDTQA